VCIFHVLQESKQTGIQVSWEKVKGRETIIPVSGDIDKDCRPGIPGSQVHTVEP